MPAMGVAKFWRIVASLVRGSCDEMDLHEQTRTRTLAGRPTNDYIICILVWHGDALRLLHLILLDR